LFFGGAAAHHANLIGGAGEGITEEGCVDEVIAISKILYFFED